MLLNKKEVSGYIDLASRLQKKEKEKTRALVKGETVLQPRKSDLRSVVSLVNCVHFHRQKELFSLELGQKELISHK